MFAAGVVLSAAALGHWWEQAGAGSLLFVLSMSLASLARELKRAMQSELEA